MWHARYTVDVSENGQLVGRILRAPWAHARVVSLDTSKAATLAGVKAVIEFPAARQVRYAGQEIVAVAAVDRATADAALERITIVYEPLPHVLTSTEARAADAPLVYSWRSKLRRKAHANEGPIIPMLWRGNLRGPFRLFSTAARRARRALSDSRATPGWTVVEDTWQTQAQSHSCLEPHACVASWRDRALTLHVSTQAVTRLAEDIAHRWNLDPRDVDVQAPYVGGAFGSKAELGPEIVAAVELSRVARVPVSVVLDRREELTVGGTRPEEELHLAVAVNPEGSLSAMVLRAYGNAGVAIGNVTSMIFRIMYPRGAKDLRDWDVVTHTPPGKPFRGPGGPPAFWALEQAVDDVAIHRHESPISLRRRWDPNPVRRQLYDWVETLDVWRNRDEIAGNGGRLRRGVGLAAAGWFDFVGTAAQVRVEARPNGLRISTATQDVGNGSRSTIADAAARVFRVPSSCIEVVIGDSRLPPGPMAAGSRTTASIVPCVEEAACELRARLFDLMVARHDLSGARATADGITHDGGSMTWLDVLGEAPPLSTIARRERDPRGFFLPVAVDGIAVGKSLTGSVQVSEVEVDVRLGHIRVRRVWVGLGAGRIVSPLLARSQVEGAVVQGIGYALYEERHIDPHHGGVLTASLDDYRLPGIADTPEIHVHFVEEGFENARSGSVGLGELGTLAAAASIGNAVRHATGWRPRQLPLRPDCVLRGLARDARHCDLRESPIGTKAGR